MPRILLCHKIRTCTKQVFNHENKAWDTALCLLKCCMHCKWEPSAVYWEEKSVHMVDLVFRRWWVSELPLLWCEVDLRWKLWKVGKSTPPCIRPALHLLCLSSICSLSSRTIHRWWQLRWDKTPDCLLHLHCKNQSDGNVHEIPIISTCTHIRAHECFSYVSTILQKLLKHSCVQSSVQRLNLM